jgi:transcriptional regulator with XRE-family HTH domain
MSSLFSNRLSRSPYAVAQRRLWGEFFGDMIREARQQRGRSIEEAARLAGMEVSRWKAVEAGQVPRTREQLQAMATGLDIEWVVMGFLAILCSPAWGR